MAKKKKSVKEGSACCSWSGCKKGDWVWTLISEAAVYGFLFYAFGGGWQNALTLWVLVNVAWFACPIVKKHFYCG